MKQVKRAFALVLCVATVLSLCMAYASAGNVCKEEEIEGHMDATVTFYISTNSRWFNAKDSIKLTGTKKGTITHGTWTSGERSNDVYGYYHVNVYEKSGDDWNYVEKSSGNWKAESALSKTHTIKKLVNNKDYKIVVTPYTLDEIYELHKIRYSASCGLGKADMYWESQPTWTVSSTTSGVMTCSK